MKIEDLLNIGGEVKIEVTLDDLKSFADYIIQNSVERVSTKDTDKFDIGGIDLAMEVTGYAKSTIQNKVSKGELPYFKKHGRIYFSRSDLLSFIKSGKHETRKPGEVINILK